MILIFGAIVLVHEYGHFIAARKCGVFVEEFAIGMGPKIISKQKKDTLYSIRVFPIGGFCKMKGEDSSDVDSDSFSNASKGKKFIILFAGAFMNFVLAFVILLGISFFAGTTTTEITNVADGSPASVAGLESGDKIYKINGEKVHIFDEISFAILKNGSNTAEIEVKRNGEKIKLNVTPKEQDGRYLIGISTKPKAPLISKNNGEHEKASFFETIYNGYWNVIFILKSTFYSFVQLFTGKVSLNQVMGPIGLAPVIDETYKTASKAGVLSLILTMLNLTAVLSANIGVLNLLPLPALDGGRILFLLLEVLRGKPIPEEKEATVNFVGFIILMGFGIFIAFKDIWNIF